MYQYFYDFFLSEEKYGKILAAVESRLADLGLQGKIERLNLFKDPAELVAEGRKRGVKTVVAVGNDATLNRVLNGLGDTDVTVGCIPIGPQNEISRILGIGEGVAGCDCLANRLTETVDLGNINGQYFLSHVKALSEGVNFRCIGDFCVRPLANHRVEIYNLPALGVEANPCDGYLEARVRPAGVPIFGKRRGAEKTESFFPVKRVFLESDDGAEVLVDGMKTINTPAEIKIIPQKLKIIVGKNRIF
jgi:diacylglycerol kinase family enzyme